MASAPWPAGAALALVLCAVPGCSRPALPPVVVITVDTLRADRLGCYGYGAPTTPRIDRLAGRGTLFRRASTSLPRTTQSIGSIMTGRFPRSHGVRGLFGALPETNLTLAEALRGRGYVTAAFVSNMFLRPGQGFDQGFDLYDNPRERWDGDSASAVTAAALAWLERVPRDRPFFLWVHYLDPHWTYAPEPRFARAFDPGGDRPVPVYDDLVAQRVTKGQVIFGGIVDSGQAERLRALYDAGIAQTDASIAPLLDRLERWPAPVLVALTSDHGESLGEHGYHFAHGEYLYEPELRIPLIFSLPGVVPEGAASDALAQNVDFAPTVLAIAGIRGMQGVEGRPLFARAGDGRLVTAPGRDLVFAESDFQLIHPENRRYHVPGPAGRWSSVSDGRHKVIHIPRPGGPEIEFYDLVADPGETRDLGREGDREARARLLRALTGFASYEAGVGDVAPSPEALQEQRERLRSLGYVN